MKLFHVRSIIAYLLILIGSVWFLQGVNILPGSFMTGQIEWAVYGALTLLAGLGLIWISKWRKK